MTVVNPKDFPVPTSAVVDLENILMPNTMTEVLPPADSQPLNPLTSMEELPSDQVISAFDKRKVIVWEEKTDTGRQFVTYDGKWWVEFLKGYHNEAIAWRDQKIKLNETTFKEYERKGRWLFEFDANRSNEELQRRGINILEERKRYDSVDTQEITPYFTEISRTVDKEVSEYLLLNPLAKLEQDRELASGMLYFSRDPSNYVSYHFGKDRTGTDVGFYRDRGNRIRASYDPQFIFRSKPLMEDLLEFGVADEYVVGRFHTGMIQFVLSEALSDRLVKKYGTEEFLAMRWNNAKLKLDGFEFGNYPTFENVINVETSEFIPSSVIFEFSSSGEKKPIANT